MAAFVSVRDAAAQVSDVEARAASGNQASMLPNYSEPEDASFSLPAVDGLAQDRDERLGVGGAMPISTINVSGVSAGPRDGINAIVARYESRGSLTPADMLSLRDEITQTYIEHGFVSSGAVLPDQDLSDRTLDIRVIEGRVIDVQVEGNNSLRDSYVTRRLWRDQAAILERGQLQQNFQLLVANPAIADIDAALVPTERLGEARLVVRVTEAERFSSAFGLGTERSPSVGGERAALSASYRNILGIGDLIGAEIGGTEGMVDGAISYDVPLNADGAALRFSADYSSADVVEQPLSELDILSQSYSYGLNASWPLWRGFRRNEADPDRSYSYQLSLGAEIRQKHAETELLGIPFSFSPGAVDGVTDITIARLSQDLVLQSRKQVFAARSTFTLGLSALESGAAITPPENFVAWLGQVQYARRFGDEGYELLARIEGQYSPDTLFTVERYAFGGSGSVRGYRRNEAIADNGAVASVEFRVPLSSLGAPELFGSSDWNVGVFAEAGHGWNSELDDPQVDTLASVGLALNFAVGDRMQGSVYYGHQLEEPPSRPERTLQDSGFGFRFSVAGW
jgi:hemolysin activation/secretion protein